MFTNLYHKRKLFFLGLIIAIIVAFLDLYSKNLVFSFLDKLTTQDSQLAVTSFFNLVKVWNTGVSFGMLNDLSNGKYIILFINLAILIILLIWLYRNQIIYLTWAISLVIGGAIGNIIDRIQHNAVADFLDFHINQYHWPAFNLADSSIFLGVALLLLENYFIKKSNDK